MFYFIKENAQLQKESHQSLSSSMVGKEQRGTRRGDAPELNPAQSSYISMVMNQLQLIVKTARPPPFLRPQVLHRLYGQRSATSLWLRVLHLYGIKSSTVSTAKDWPRLYGCESSMSMVSSPPLSLWSQVLPAIDTASPPAALRSGQSSRNSTVSMITVTFLQQETTAIKKHRALLSLQPPINPRRCSRRSIPSPLLSVALSPPAAFPASPWAPPTAAPIGCGCAGTAPGGGDAQHGARGDP